MVTTLGKLNNNMKNRNKKDVMSLDDLKAVVIDEADWFFGTEHQQDFKALSEIVDKRLKDKKIQYILFSATYPEEVKQAIFTIIKEAQQIKLTKEKLQLNHIKQFHYRC